MKRTVKTIMTVVLSIAMLTSLAACAEETGSTSGTTAQGTTAAESTSGLTGTIVCSGSTSMEELMTALGESFNVAFPGVEVEIQGGGSSTGVKNAAEGVSDIGNASRALKDEEKGLGLVETVVAIDGIVVVVNPTNPVTDLTSQQVIDLFTGKITNWKDVGGADAPVVVILREAGSGTRDGFESILKIADQCVGSQEVNETGIVKSTVAGNVNAIGYISLGKVDETVTAITLDGVVPSEETVKDGSYKLQRPFTCLTKGEPAGLAKTFLDYILSEDGQAMVTQKGFVSVK